MDRRVLLGIDLGTTALKAATFDAGSGQAVCFARPADANPCADLRGVRTDAYHVDQRGDYGDGWRWVAVRLQPQRRYCIGQYAWMNTVDGPFDGLGNGTGGRRDAPLADEQRGGRPLLYRTDESPRRPGFRLRA